MFSFFYNNSDISLSERQNLLDLSDENLCENDCNYSNFDIEMLKTICICKVGNINNIIIIFHSQTISLDKIWIMICLNL